MTQSIRHPEILDIARRDGKVTVDMLAGHFDVTLQTIRRDLSDLANAGKLERVHGGAVLPSGTSNIGYQDRQGLHQSGKARIARACAAAIPNAASVFLNIGTSTEAVARELLDHSNLLVVTNNINVANILSANPACEVILTGGVLRRSDGGLVGNLTSQTIAQFRFDIAVIGCSAIDPDGDLMDYDIREVGVSQTIIARARTTYLVADHSKLLRTAPAKICSLGDIGMYFTDIELPVHLKSLCAAWGTQIILPTDDPSMV